MNIRNRTLIVALIGLGALATAPAAHAQYFTSVAQPIRVDIGGFFPTDSTVTSTLRRTAIYGGVSYDINSSKGVNPTVEGIYLDASNNSDGGVHATIIGLGVQARIYANGTNAPTTGSGSLYFGGGLGVYFVNTSFLSDSNHTEFGGKVFLGYELTQGLFVEGGFTYITSVNGVNPSGFTAVIGYKF
jgi:hypothetical protein